jgi:LPS O-antigen subunit length determinant protein (WzzB/FepE family)
MDALVNNTNALLNEYNTILVKDIASNVVSPVSEEGTNTLLFAAIGLVLGGMISLGVVFIDHTMKEYKKKKQA